MVPNRPVKPATTVNEQIGILRSRNMTISDATAMQWLQNVSYYRLSAYWYPARLPLTNGTRSDIFADGTSFEDVVNLYEADRKLRTLVHDGMERVEIAMRTRISEVICEIDPLAYTDKLNFRPSFKHSEWVSTATRRIKRASRTNDAIRHYQREYGGQYPFWVLAEVLDFSDISKIFQGLSTVKQRRISEDLGIFIELSKLSKNQQQKIKKKSPLAAWLEQLTIVRNTCAHHGRLWNNSFIPVPTAPLRTQENFALLPEGQSEKLFGALLLMAHIVRRTSPGTSWPEKVRYLIAEDFLTNPLVTPSALGLPSVWEDGF